jgi:hypothetical protein
MSDNWARNFVACINARDADRLARFFEEDAVLISPDWSSGEYQEVRLDGRQKIRDDWAARLERMDYVDAMLDSVCEGTDGLAMVYRVNAVQMVEVITVSDRGLISSCKRYGGPTVGGYTFYSYAHGTGLGQQIAAFMEREELPAWIDSHLNPGETWAEVIEERIAGASAFVVIMDDRSAASDYVQRELALARKLGKPVIPVLAGKSPFPDLTEKQYVRWNQIAFPESGFSEFLRDLVAPGIVPSERLQRRRVDYFMRTVLKTFFGGGKGMGEFGVGMSYYHWIAEDQPLDDLDELDWAEVVLRLHENVPSIRFEDYFGESYRDYGKRFPTPTALVEALLEILTWEQIRRLGRREARMRSEAGD